MKPAAAKTPAEPKATLAKAAPALAKRPSPPVAKTAAPAKAPAASKKIAPSLATTPIPPKILPMPTVVAAPVPTPVKKDPRLANNWKTKTAHELTDAEVIAMPDSEYMNDKQMAYFRLKLVQLKDDILANAGETTGQFAARAAAAAGKSTNMELIVNEERWGEFQHSDQTSRRRQLSSREVK